MNKANAGRRIVEEWNSIRDFTPDGETRSAGERLVQFHASEGHVDASDERETVFDMLVSLGVYTRQQGMPYDSLLEAVLNGRPATSLGRSGTTAEIVDALAETLDDALETTVSAVRNHMGTEMGPERTSPSLMSL